MLSPATVRDRAGTCGARWSTAYLLAACCCLAPQIFRLNTNSHAFSFDDHRLPCFSTRRGVPDVRCNKKCIGCVIVFRTECPRLREFPREINFGCNLLPHSVLYIRAGFGFPDTIKPPHFGRMQSFRVYFKDAHCFVCVENSVR